MHSIIIRSQRKQAKNPKFSPFKLKFLSFLKNEAADDGVLSLKLLLPVCEDGDLLVGEIGDVTADVFFVLAHLGEGAGCLAAGEEGVGAAGAVEVSGGGDVVDGGLDGDVDGLARVRSVEFLQLLRGELHCSRSLGCWIGWGRSLGDR